MTKETPTPETDALAVVCYGEGGIEASYGFRAVPIKDCRKLEHERDEAREQLNAMREAIREVYNSFADEPASDSAWLLDDRQTAALAKLQPFLP